MSKKLIKNIVIYNIDRNGYNTLYCFDDCVATVAKKENIDYQMMYLNYINFIYDYDKALENRKVITGIVRDNNEKSFLYELLEKHHGLILKEHKIGMIEMAYKSITEEIRKGKMVFVRLDSFYCEWDVLYNKEHTKHMGLCIGYDDEKVFLCDPFYGIECIEMDISNFKVANQGIFFTYEVVNKKADSAIINNKSKILNSLVKDNAFEKRLYYIKKFAEAYGTFFSYKNEYQDFNEAMLSFDVILDIIIKTSKYFNFLKYLKSPTDEIRAIMTEIIGSWVVIKNTLFKGFFKQNDDVGKKIEKRLNEIIIKEQEIVAYMCVTEGNEKKIQNNLCYEENKRKVSNTEEDIYTVDIESALNNNSFGNWEDQNCWADFSGLDEFLQCTIDERFIKHNGYKLFTYITADNTFDNIECDGQNIKIDSDNIFNKIGFIAVSEFGETIDVLKLKYSSGVIEKVHINVTDVNLEPMYCEEIIWRGVTYQRDEKGKCNKRLENAHLFWIEYNIVQKENIKEIILPECSNLHIYGIYLFK